MHVLVTCKYKKDRIKNNREKVETLFFPLQVKGVFLLPWKPEFWSNLPQNLMQPFPHPSDATHKIWSRLANWLQRYSSLKVWTTTDDGRTDGRTDGSLVYYKLTLWAFGSGELKIWRDTFFKSFLPQRNYGMDSSAHWEEMNCSYCNPLFAKLSTLYIFTFQNSRAYVKCCTFTLRDSRIYVIFNLKIAGHIWSTSTV